MAEVFFAMQEARRKLQEIRKDRGYGKASLSSSSTSLTSTVSFKK